LTVHKSLPSGEFDFDLDQVLVLQRAEVGKQFVAFQFELLDSSLPVDITLGI
jgi:hypothetical protein